MQHLLFEGPLQAASEIQYLSPLAVGFASLLIVVQALVSLHLHLGLHYQLLLAAFRCILQLSILGYILVPIFNYGHWWPVLLYVSFMISVSAVEAVGRPPRHYNGMFLNTLIIITCCASATMAYATFIILRVHPWWQPNYIIPILGMVLGNTISGISVGLSTTIEELSSGQDRIEKLLALGATRWEATQELITRAVKLAMTPLLNQMSVVGLVSIPGMMTGQILSGSDPSQAARYQMIIMFMLGAASTMGAVASIYACVGQVVDTCHRLQPDKLLVSTRRGGVTALLTSCGAQVSTGVASCLAAIQWCCSSICGSRKGKDAGALGAQENAQEARRPLLQGTPGLDEETGITGGPGVQEATRSA